MPPDVERLKPTEGTAATASLMADPANQFYRYPVARAILPLFMRTPLTPNQITVMHTLIGVLGAVLVAQGTARGLVWAFFLLEIRMILDCLDGVLARAKKMSSPYGRTVDELGDGVAFLALCIGMAIHVRHHEPSLPFAAGGAAVLVTGALMGWSHDFYKRKFTGALKDGIDVIAQELYAKHVRMRQNDANFIVRFGFLFDWLQVSILQPAVRGEVMKKLDEAARAGLLELRIEGDPQVEHILQHAERRGFRFLMRSIAAMCGDNLVGLLHVAFLWIGLTSMNTGRALWQAQMSLMAYGVFALGLTVILAHSFLAGPRDVAPKETREEWETHS